MPDADNTPDLSELLEVKRRYDHAVELARASRCVCNSARSFGDIDRELLDYLLQGDALSVAPSEISVELRAHHCPVHSPPLRERPWLLADVPQALGRLTRGDGESGPVWQGGSR